MDIKEVNILSMPMEEWTHKSCTAHFCIGDDWATLSNIESQERNKGHATELLTEAKKHYQAQGKKFGGTVALNDVMKHIYQKLEIEEYNEI